MKSNNEILESFNSSKVRYDDPRYYDIKKIEVCFNSSKVRYDKKLSPQIGILRTVFQFLKGTIRRKTEERILTICWVSIPQRYDTTENLLESLG